MYNDSHPRLLLKPEPEPKLSLKDAVARFKRLL